MCTESEGQSGEAGQRLGRRSRRWPCFIPWRRSASGSAVPGDRWSGPWRRWSRLPGMKACPAASGTAAPASGPAGTGPDRRRTDPDRASRQEPARAAALRRARDPAAGRGRPGGGAGPGPRGPRRAGAAAGVRDRRRAPARGPRPCPAGFTGHERQATLRAAARTGDAAAPSVGIGGFGARDHGAPRAAADRADRRAAQHRDADR